MITSTKICRRFINVVVELLGVTDFNIKGYYFKSLMVVLLLAKMKVSS